MNIWYRLFLDGEYAPPKYILSGLGLEHLSVRPDGAPHSIYEELWHTARWQNLVLDRDEEAYRRWQQGEIFPPTQMPIDEAAWRHLVAEFLAGLERAVNMAADEDVLSQELAPGLAMRHALELLAVHNAYHLGKIVLLRQLLGIWTPQDAET